MILLSNTSNLLLYVGRNDDRKIKEKIGKIITKVFLLKATMYGSITFEHWPLWCLLQLSFKLQLFFNWTNFGKGKYQF